MEQKMFCYQCQETAGCKGCTVVGVCGKQPDVAAMQDLLVWVTKGISAVTTRLREEGRAVADEVNHLVTENLFTTITNANFDKAAIEKRIEKTLEMKTALWEQLERRDNLPEETPRLMEIRRLLRLISVSEVIRAFLFQDMICAIWKCFWSRRREPASMYIRTRRCFRRSIIRHLRNIRILRVITAMHGGVRRRNLRCSMDRS